MFKRPSYPYRRGCEPFTLRVPSQGSRDAHGEWVAGAETSHQVTGHAHPLSAGAAEMALPEGARTVGAMRFLLPPVPGVDSVMLAGRGGGAGLPSAAVEYSGNRYRVVNVLPWNDGGKQLGLELVCLLVIR